MDTLLKLVPFASDLWVYLAIDVSLILALLMLMQWITGWQRKNTVAEELGVNDNFAFGISTAGGMLALCIVMATAVGRHVGAGYDKAAIGMLTFGLVGIVLVKFGRFAHDKLVLDRLDSPLEIAHRSVSVALIDAASLVASAIILRSMMLWVEGSDMNALIAITSGFMVALMVLLIMTRLYEYRYARDNQNDSFQGALRKGQLALSLEHSGSLLGTAIVVSSADSLLVYSPEGYVSNITGWIIVCATLAVTHWILLALAKRVILRGLNYQQEVDQQHNIGVAAVEFTLSIGIALVVSGILR